MENKTASNRSIAQDRDRVRALLAQRAAKPVGRIVFLQGEAEVFEPESQRWHSARQGATLSNGQRVRVSSGRLLLRLSDGSDTWLAPGAEVDLSAWKSATRSLRLVAGRLFALVARHPDNPFCVLSNAAEIRVTGTAFEAHATPASLDVAVFHGSVSVSNRSRTSRAARGHCITATPSSISGGRFQCDRSRLAWIGGAELSLANPKIASAAKTLAASLEEGLDPRKDLLMNTKKIALGITGIAVVAAILFTVALQTGALAKVIGDGDISLTYRDPSGREWTADGRNKASVDALRARMPESTRKGMDESLERALSEFGGAEIFVSDTDTPEMTAMIDRESKAATQSYREMIARGVPKEKAKEAVAAAFAESMRAQQRAKYATDQIAVSVDAVIVEVGGQPDVHFTMRTSLWDGSPVPEGMTKEEFDKAQTEYVGGDGVSVGGQPK